MKLEIQKWLVATLATLATLTIITQVFLGEEVKANDGTKYEIYGENGEFIYPDNTKCNVLNTVNNDRISHQFNNGITFYEMCLGSFPKYASTKVEEGLMPVYFAKYYFYPNPMPIYKDVSNGEDDGLGGKTAAKTYSKNNLVAGLKFKVEPLIAYEKKDEPSFRDIYYLYPNNSDHNSTNPNVMGPYQIGYNSFYHNAFRSRSFAYITDFDFKIYEPVLGVTTDEKKDSKVLFEGKIVYEMDETCFDTDYLVYAEHCQSVEFYFPKGKVIDKSEDNVDKATAEDGKMINIFSENNLAPAGNETNAVPVDRVHYRNPGVHTITLVATERLALRSQKDIGTEYQTKGNPNSVQNVNPTDDSIYYFDRTDVDLKGNSIIPNALINRVVSEVYREGNVAGNNPDGEFTLHNGKIALSATQVLNSGVHYKITNQVTNGGKVDYEYDSFVRFLNYCTMNTDAFGVVLENRKPYTGTKFILSPEQQKESACYHNHSRENHFWQYKWSETEWINK